MIWRNTDMLYIECHSYLIDEDAHAHVGAKNNTNS